MSALCLSRRLARGDESRRKQQSPCDLVVEDVTVGPLDGPLGARDRIRRSSKGRRSIRAPTIRRAFVLAGAKTLVMSPWKVPDAQTQELMEDFYRRLLVAQGRAEAPRSAQLRLKAKYPDPYYWGAFICQGDLCPSLTISECMLPGLRQLEGDYGGYALHLDGRYGLASPRVTNPIAYCPITQPTSIRSE